MSTLTVDVWPEGVPGAISNASYGTEYTEYPDGDRESARLYRITQPRLEVYLPDPAVATGSAVVIAPGGGYAFLSHAKEGRRVARWLCEEGIAGLVLLSRLPSRAVMEDAPSGPLADARQALRLVRRRAEEWRLDPARIAMMGFSAGGHLAASAATLDAAEIDAPARPDRSILVYPVLSMDPAITHGGSSLNLLGPAPEAALIDRFSLERQVTAQTPPTFVVHSADDAAVPLAHPLRYVSSLSSVGVPVELHVFPTGGHGYGMETALGASRFWPELLLDWLQRQGW